MTAYPNATRDQHWRLLYSRKLEVEAVEAFRFFRKRNIEPILIKGWAAARNYPDTHLRFYGDIDLAVDSEDHEKAERALASDEGRHIAVDLHRELRHLDTKPWKSIIADSELVELNNESVRIPCSEDHLRILSTHWLNDGGERKDRLWDIYYAVVNRPEGFSWEKCLGPVSAIRRHWVIASIGMAHLYLGLDIKGLPFELEARNLPPWLVRTVEAKWRSNTRHRSLHTCLNDPVEFFKQLRRRFPPDPLQATIEMEGDITDGRRIGYQLGSIRRRIYPSVQRLSESLRLRFLR